MSSFICGAAHKEPKRSDSPQSRLELGLCLSRGFLRAHNLDADAHRDDGKRFVRRVAEKLTAFIELESAIIGHASPRFKSRSPLLSIA